MGNSALYILEKFKVPKRYANICWDDLKLISADEKGYASTYVSKFPDNKKECVYLYNPVSGTGKTGYALCLAIDLINSGKLSSYVLFMPYIVLMDSLRQDVSSFMSTTTFSYLMGADFIIFDDVGVERLGSSVAERYYLLLEHMWQEKKAAIFTSKFTINQLLNRADDNVDDKILDSIGSRLVGICDEFELKNEEDFRDIDE